jgi:hypothetical protein
MRIGQQDAVGRRDPHGTTDGSTTGRGRDQRQGRTGMTLKLNRQVVPVVVSAALLVLLVAGVVVRQARVSAPALPMTGKAAAVASAGDQLNMPGGSATNAGATRSEIRAAQAAAGVGRLEFFPGEEYAVANRPARGAAGSGLLEFLPGEAPLLSLSAARPSAEVGPIEYLPGEGYAIPLPSFAPAREAAPDFGPQP